MSEPTPTTPFAIFGLYRDRTTPAVLLAADRADALRQYHAQYPGLEGTTFVVKTLEELAETNDG